MARVERPNRIASFLGHRIPAALGAAAALAAISLSPGSAQAACAPGTPASTCRVTVGGVNYDVTTFTGTYDANSSKFDLPANGGEMPWWSSPTPSSSKAVDFATAVGNYFGPNLYYAYYDLGASYPIPSTRFSVILWQGSNYTGSGTGASASVKYAVAREVPYTAPGPLPLFGAGAAFGFSRRLRKRIQGARQPLASSQPRA